MIQIVTMDEYGPNTTNPAISLVVNNVIHLLIGPQTWAPITLTMYHMGKGTQPCPFPVMGNGHGQVTEPKGDQFSGRNLGMIPKRPTLVPWYNWTASTWTKLIPALLEILLGVNEKNFSCGQVQGQEHFLRLKNSECPAYVLVNFPLPRNNKITR